MSNSLDRRRLYDKRVGKNEVVKQQTRSNAKRFIKQFATKDDVIDLIDLYHLEHPNDNIYDLFKTQ